MQLVCKIMNHHRFSFFTLSSISYNYLQNIRLTQWTMNQSWPYSRKKKKRKKEFKKTETEEGPRDSNYQNIRERKDSAKLEENGKYYRTRVIIDEEEISVFCRHTHTIRSLEKISEVQILFPFYNIIIGCTGVCYKIFV